MGIIPLWVGMSNNMRYNLAMCFDDDEEAIEEIEELYTIIPVIDSGVDDSEERQYDDLDDEEFDCGF